MRILCASWTLAASTDRECFALETFAYFISEAGVHDLSKVLASVWGRKPIKVGTIL